MAVMLNVLRLFPKLVKNDNGSHRICVVRDHFPKKGGRCE
jgi:hypothetical protein